LVESFELFTTFFEGVVPTNVKADRENIKSVSTQNHSLSQKQMSFHKGYVFNTKQNT